MNCNFARLMKASNAFLPISRQTSHLSADIDLINRPSAKLPSRREIENYAMKKTYQTFLRFALRTKTADTKIIHSMTKAAKLAHDFSPRSDPSR